MGGLPSALRGVWAAGNEVDRRRGNVITTTYTCGCGHHHKSSLSLARPKEKPDPQFKLDRRRFCFDDSVGKRFSERRAHLQHLHDLLKRSREGQGDREGTDEELTRAVSEIKTLKVAQVASELSKAAAKANYTEFRLAEPQVGREVVVPFSCLDSDAKRDGDESRRSLKKIVTRALADSNWRLMSDGVHYRLGYLSGRVRAYETDEDLQRLAAKEVKRSGQKRSGQKTDPAPVPPQSEPSPTLATHRRRSHQPERRVRVTAVLHPQLQMLIPPRERARGAL